MKIGDQVVILSLKDEIIEILNKCDVEDLSYTDLELVFDYLGALSFLLQKNATEEELEIINSREDKIYVGPIEYLLSEINDNIEKVFEDDFDLIDTFNKVLYLGVYIDEKTNFLSKQDVDYLILYINGESYNALDKNELINLIEDKYKDDVNLQKYIDFINGEDVDCDIDLLLFYKNNSENETYIINDNAKTPMSKSIISMNLKNIPTKEDIIKSEDILNYIKRTTEYDLEEYEKIYYVLDNIFTLSLINENGQTLGNILYDMETQQTQTIVYTNIDDISLILNRIEENLVFYDDKV